MADNRKIWSTLTFTIAIFLILDQATKVLARTNLYACKSIPVVKGFLSLNLVKNTGVAFGLLKGQILLFQVIAIIMVGLIVYYLVRQKPSSRLVQISLGLILAGAVGNFIDRALYGAVTDFIDFHFWPVFNVADSSIVVGATILITKSIFNNER